MGAAAIPSTDAASLDALDAASISGLHCHRCRAAGQGEVLRDVHSQEFSTADSYHCVADYECGVPGGASPEVFSMMVLSAGEL